MKLLVSACVLVLVLMSSCAVAEEKPALVLPDSDIYLFSLRDSKTILQVSNGSNVTHHQGYDNQPFFTPQSRSFLFTSQRSPEQTDIYEYFIESKNTVQLTNTPEQEYTAKVSPDNKIISFVREGGNPNQSLWQMDRTSGEVAWALKSLEPVGYYDWNHKTNYIVLWVRYAFSLQLLQVNTDLSELITGNALPTAPQTIPGTQEFSVMHRQMDDTVWIKAFDPKTRALRPLVRAVEHSRDYAWMPSGRLLMGYGAKLYQWDGKLDGDWHEVVSLQQYSIENITRLAVSPDGKWLAVVSQ